MIVLVVAIIGLFIWQTISNKKRQKEAQNMVDSIKVGDRVKTIGGICGFIVEIRDSDNTFVLRTGLDDSSDYIRFDKVAIYQTAPADGGKKEAVSEAPKAEEQPAAETESDK
ncbi:MAG: preprotein translocase subunit YajC [Clostridiales bacterium]|nr:preprotein translocase subunit YajC [Clostridiales bacterium]